MLYNGKEYTDIVADLVPVYRTADGQTFATPEEAIDHLTNNDNIDQVKEFLESIRIKKDVNDVLLGSTGKLSGDYNFYIIKDEEVFDAWFNGIVFLYLGDNKDYLEVQYEQIKENATYPCFVGYCAQLHDIVSQDDLLYRLNRIQELYDELYAFTLEES